MEGLVVLIFFLLGSTIVALIRRAIPYWRRRKAGAHPNPVPDGPEDEPYRVFTDAFDVVQSAEELPGALLQGNPDLAKGWTDPTGGTWERALAQAEECRSSEIERKLLVEEGKRRLAASGLTISDGGLAVTFLVDQSGSMRGHPMAAVRNTLEIVADIFQHRNVSLEILGYSTVGWHGGRAYQHWRDQGRPARPGRLCVLRHIIYKEADQSRWSDASRRAMLHLDLLRENVDGEALRWAAHRLRDQIASRRVLIVVSDGAPVDDATLIHNGLGYLDRDLRRAIAELDASGDILLGAVGVDYDVRRYYERSRVAGLDRLSAAIIDQAFDLAQA